METLIDLAETQFALTYNDAEIAADLAPFFLSLTYTDKLSGESDELDVQLDDSDGRWRGAWYPSKKARLDLTLFQNKTKLHCGLFEIESISYACTPNIITLKCLASGISKPIRTKKAKAYENTSLKKIAVGIAKQHGLILSGEIKDVIFTRQTQFDETDLQFLQRLARQYGHDFAVRGQKLVFWHYADLQKNGSALRFLPENLSNLSFDDKSHDTYQACRVTWHNPKTKKRVQFTVGVGGENFGSDLLKITARCETEAQARAWAEAALARANGKTATASFSQIGNLSLVAGANIELAEIGVFSGKYQITQSRHELSRDAGHRTSVDVKKI